MPSQSNALEYFNQICAKDDTYAFLESLAVTDPPTIETEWLEFKGCDRISESQIKSYWSEALSGFANTGGGVLVWGLDARKEPETQVDKVIGVSLHPDAEVLASRLRELVVQSVDPPIGGVEIKPIRRDNSKAGFVVCFIPEGKAKAHRAESADRNYYLRIGTSFVIPPVSVLRSLFSPKAGAYLVPSIWVVPRSVTPSEETNLRFIFCLRNTGTLTARNISILIGHPKSLHFGAIQTNLTLSPSILHERIPLTLGSPINPEMDQDGLFVLHHPDPVSLQAGFKFTIQTSCEDSPVVRWARWMSHYDYLKNQRLAFALLDE